MNLLTQRTEIRKLIGVCPQEIVISGLLSALENVSFIAESFGYSKKKARIKAQNILNQLGIGDRKDAAKNLSGGMKRRLNLAMALVHNPRIVFLDEPSAGLDPQSRRVVWDFIKDLKGKGVTIILTTHDMEEADTLSDHIAIIDAGKIIAYGTPKELKDQFTTGKLLEVQLENELELQNAKHDLTQIQGVSDVSELNNQRLLITYTGSLNFNEVLLRYFMIHYPNVENFNFRQKSLEDVFLQLTGKELRD
jgi:ABC-2 type transport system ATP-binding protein